MALTREGVERSLEERVGELPLFEGLEDEARARFSRMCLCHDHPENNILLYQDDPADHIYLVLEGRVKLTLANRDGRMVVLSVVEPGGLVGVAGLLHDGTHAATAITASPCRLARVKGESFVGWLERYPEACRSLTLSLAERLSRAQRKIGAHALLSVKERLLYTLADMARREGQPAPGGEGVEVERPTHQELAYRIGSSREVVTRMLSELMEEGALEGEGRVITVPESALVLRGE